MYKSKNELHTNGTVNKFTLANDKPGGSLFLTLLMSN